MRTTRTSWPRRPNSINARPLPGCAPERTSARSPIFTDGSNWTVRGGRRSRYFARWTSLSRPPAPSSRHRSLTLPVTAMAQPSSLTATFETHRRSTFMAGRPFPFLAVSVRQACPLDCRSVARPVVILLCSRLRMPTSRQRTGINAGRQCSRGLSPSPSGRGQGEGHKSIQILRPSPYPLPEGEGRSFPNSVHSHLLKPATTTLHLRYHPASTKRRQSDETKAYWDVSCSDDRLGSCRFRAR